LFAGDEVDKNLCSCLEEEEGGKVVVGRSFFVKEEQGVVCLSRGDEEEVKTAPLVRGRRGRGKRLLLPRRGGGGSSVLGRLFSDNEEEVKDAVCSRGDEELA
jgi:hypothetical protein